MSDPLEAIRKIKAALAGLSLGDNGNDYEDLEVILAEISDIVEDVLKPSIDVPPGINPNDPDSRIGGGKP